MHAVITFFLYKFQTMQHDTRYCFSNILEIILLHQLKYRL